MTLVAGKNRTNRPYFFTQSDGERMEVPSFGQGQGDLEGNQLREFRMYEQAGQITPATASIAPENTAVPTITGTAQVGQTLTGTNGTWTGTPAPTYSRQWKADGANISGATSATYKLTTAELGKVITLTVTATNEAGTASATSAATGAVVAALAAPVNTTAPAVTGTPEVDSVLTTTNGTWTGNPTPTYARAWQRSADGTTGWVAISGATATTYTLTAADDAHYVRCAVTGTNSQGAVTATSNAVGPITTADTGE